MLPLRWRREGPCHCNTTPCKVAAIVYMGQGGQQAIAIDQDVRDCVSTACQKFHSVPVGGCILAHRCILGKGAGWVQRGSSCMPIVIHKLDTKIVCNILHQLNVARSLPQHPTERKMHMTLLSWSQGYLKSSISMTMQIVASSQVQTCLLKCQWGKWQKGGAVSNHNKCQWTCSKQPVMSASCGPLYFRRMRIWLAVCL